MAKKNFTHTWSMRFVDRMQHPSKLFRDATIQKWTSEIHRLPSTAWWRVTYHLWQGQSLEHMTTASDWMTSAFTHACFVRNRGANSLSTGYQLWFSNEDDVLVAKLTIPDPIIQIRAFSSTELCEQIHEHFLKPYQQF